MQMLDLFLLAMDRPIDYIPDRNHSHDDLILYYRQMANAEFGHQPHALTDAAVGLYDGSATHDFADQRILRSLPLQNDLAGIIALGKNAEKVAARHDEQRPDIVLGHNLERFVDRRLRRYKPDLTTLMIENRANSILMVHESLRPDDTSERHALQGASPIRRPARAE